MSSRKSKNKTPAMASIAEIHWQFDPEIPVYDFLQMELLDDSCWLGEAVDNFVSKLKSGTFVIWEAVIRKEQGLLLSAEQKKLFDSLLNFSDDSDEDPILYIDGLPRPSEPWHVILGKLAPHLLIEPFRTFDLHDEVQCEGWNEIVSALVEHGEGLSLPAGVNSLEETAPEELRHKLWLQFCFLHLDGLGQEPSLTLEDSEEHYRISGFIEALKNFKTSIAYFDLTLESLLAKIILPAKDREILIDLMLDELGMDSAEDPLAERLKG